MKGRDARDIGRAAARVCDDSPQVVSMGDTLSQLATQGCDTESSEHTEHVECIATHASSGAPEKMNRGQC